LLGDGKPYWTALAFTVVLAAVCVYVSQRALKNREM